jgi:ABC-type multidrug transport system permease subunit
MTPNFFRTILAIFRKDLAIWLLNKRNVSATIVPPLSFLLIQALGAAAVGRSPVALVTYDQRAKGLQMEQIFHQADVFRITDATSTQAQKLYNDVQIIAIITIPADFTERVERHDPSPILVKVNNLNLDFTNDIRRAVPDAITQFYQAQGSKSPILVTMHEQDLRDRDIELFQYGVLPTIILLLTLSGLVTSSIATAREWETCTVKEILLSPASHIAIIIGKVLAGFVTTFCLGLLIFLLSCAFGLLHPEGIFWLTSLLIMALVALFSTGLGVAIGAALQKIQPVISISINIAIYLFFLAGGVGVLAFEPLWLQNIAAFVPLTYGMHALEQAVFYSASDQLGRDMIILALCALAALGLGTLSMRHGIAS